MQGYGRICLARLRRHGRDCYVGAVPSPVGHLIAGAAIAWAAEFFQPLRSSAQGAAGPSAPLPIVTPLVLACAAFALAPDLDILLASHRTFTHSVAAVASAAIACGVVARMLGAPGLATGITCGLAVGSHILLDWLGHDGTPPIGLMALWPLSSAFYYSGLDLFADVSRRYWQPDEFIFKNAISVARELLILAPVAALAWGARRRRQGPAGRDRLVAHGLVTSDASSERRGSESS